MIASILPLLFSLQAASVPQPSAVPPPPRPGMVYNDITGHYVPIIGYHADNNGPHEVVKGTKLERRRVGQKISEAPIPR